MTKINCLDYGYVRLVDSMGSDLSIVRSARVSYAADWRAGTLIRYLWENQHTTPFESVTLTFEAKAPIFVFRQWHRHRTWSFNEVSARYTELPEQFYVPNVADIGVQSKDNKQARDFSPSILLSEQEQTLKRQEVEHYKRVCQEALVSYRKLLDQAQWPRELARMCLPLSTYSKMFATVDLLNLLKFLKLRDHEHAQYEIRVYAQAMAKLARSVVPITMETVFPETQHERA